MIPVVFKIPLFGGIPVYSFGLMMALAFVAGSVFLKYRFRREGLKPEFADFLAFMAALTGITGAKIYYLLFENYEGFITRPMEKLLSGAGLTWYGGLIAATLTMMGIIRYKKLPLGKTLDLITPVVPLGYGIGRIGCHLSGDGDYGIPWDGWWAADYSNGIVPPSRAFRGTDIASNYPGGVVPDDTLCHPTPLYETVFSLILFFILLRTQRKNHPPGHTVFLFLILGGMERFGIEYLRLNPKIIFGLTHAQIISIVMMIIGTAGLLFILKKETRNNENF